MSLLDFLVSPAAAQAAGQPAQGGGGTLIMMGGLFLVMFFLMIWPQHKRAKEHRNLISRLQKGDEVVTSGGLAGRIEELDDHFVTLEVAPKVGIKIQRGAVTAVLPKGTLKNA